MKRENQEEILGRHFCGQQPYKVKVTDCTNRNAVSMEDMSAATTRAASMASELNVGEQQLSAVIGTIAARTRASGDEIGNAIKSLLINVTNVQNAKIAKTFEEAGVAQTEFVNGVEQMRNPIDILEDLAEVFNSLSESDPLRNDILMNIGQKYQADVCLTVQKCAA